MDLGFLPLDAILSYGMKTLVFLGGLAALIFVHELGHFLIARKCGVVVEKFSLGFGPKIWGFKSGDTEYLVAAIPLGGYVKMKGEDPGETLTDTEGSFSAASVKNRLAIAFGGPLFNFIFAVVIYFFVYLNGNPTVGTTIGTIQADSPAEKAGLITGDKIVQLNGKEIKYWDQLLQTVHAAPGIPMQFLIERNKTELIEVEITPVSAETVNLFNEKEQVGLIGVSPLARNIAFVHKDSAADRAGLKEGDELLSIDDVPIRSMSDLKTAAIDKPGQEVTFKIRRDGADLLIKLTPEPKTVKDPSGKSIEFGLIGINMTGDMVLEKYGVFGSAARAVEETGHFIYLIAVSIKKLIFGSISAKTVGGPILIFQIYGQQAERGFGDLIRLTAILSINLGLLNLLPIPILDGGHILFFMIEWIKGKPVSERNRERASQVGLFMLLSLMVFAFYNDIVRIMS